MNSEIVSVWFDQLGWDMLQLNKIAFTLFGKLEVRWYGILITLGIVLAFVYASLRGKYNEGIVVDDILDVGIVTVILGVIGARLYYVLTSLDQFPTLGSVFAIWNGGLGIYGGIIGGCLGIVIVCLIKKISWRRLFDAVAPGVMLAQAIGRWGNFFNGEAYGYAIDPVSKTSRYFFFLKEFELPCGEGTLFNLFRMGLYPNDIAPGYMAFVHPTFLYECIWNLIGFVWINLVYKHKKFDGQIALLYFTWYGFGRMFIEGLRTDSLYILQGVVSESGLRISQCVGLLCFLAGLTLLIVFGIRSRKNLDGIMTVRELPTRRATADGGVVVVGEETETEETETETVDATETDEVADTDETESEPLDEEPNEEDKQNGNEN